MQARSHTKRVDLSNGDLGRREIGVVAGTRISTAAAATTTATGTSTGTGTGTGGGFLTSTSTSTSTSVSAIAERVAAYERQYLVVVVSEDNVTAVILEAVWRGKKTGGRGGVSGGGSGSGSGSSGNSPRIQLQQNVISALPATELEVDDAVRTQLPHRL